MDLLIAELERWYSDVDTQYNQDLEDEVDLRAGRQPDGSSRSKNALANSQVREILSYILIDAGFKFVLEEISYIDEQLNDSISPNVTVI